MSSKESENFDKQHREVLESVRLSRIILPVLLGVGVVIYLLWSQFDPVEFAKIRWTYHTFFWIGASVFFLVVRHLAYAYRLRLLSDGEFGWKKCIELIFIWEFSSAVSPTSLGGSAVALFVLTQEKLSTAKTATIVLYTVVLDTLFFIAFLPLLIGLLGFGVIHPSMGGFGSLNAWGISFWIFYLLMATYGFAFYYGLFINPGQMKRIMVWFTKISFLKKYRRSAVEMGENMILTSGQLKRRNKRYHLAAFLSTAVAWSFRFILVNCLIIAFVPDTSLEFFNQLMLYARQKAMFVLIAFSPTPGGAGFIEVVFGGFLRDFVPVGIAAIIAFVWRLLTYYAYLLAGAVILPNWIRGVVARRKAARKMSEEETQAE